MALLRLSGPKALEIAGRIFRTRASLAEAPRLALLGNVVDAAGLKVDQVLATYFPNPGSYTGEDVVELACHGGVLVTRKLLGGRAGSRCKICRTVNSRKGPF